MCKRYQPELDDPENEDDEDEHIYVNTNGTITCVPSSQPIISQSTVSLLAYGNLCPFLSAYHLSVYSISTSLR